MTRVLAKITSKRTGAVAYLDRRACPTDHPEHYFASIGEALEAFGTYSDNLIAVVGRCAWELETTVIK